jgi:iron complex transport system substrate-binding protein
MNMSHRVRRALLATLSLVPFALVTACGGEESGTTPVETTVVVDSTSPTDTGSPATGPGDGFPVTVAGGAGEVTLDARPERIVVLSPTHTEMLFAIGAQDQIVAIDDQSNFPPEALELPNELSGFQPSLEAITAYEPDLVVVGDDFTGLTGQLAPLGIPVWSGPTAVLFDDVYSQIRQLGELTGRVDESDAVAAELEREIDALAASITPADEPLTYYVELDETYYSVTANTLIGEVAGLFGLRNITDAAEVSSDYPQLSAEFIVEQGPDLILLACTKYCGTNLESVAARPGWDALPAVVTGGVVELDDDVVSRWGPRVVEFVAALASALEELGARA